MYGICCNRDKVTPIPSILVHKVPGLGCELIFDRDPLAFIHHLAIRFEVNTPEHHIGRRMPASASADLSVDSHVIVGG